MWWTGFRLFVFLWLIVGVVYPLLITVIANFTMPYQSHGSLIKENGVILGSALIGQPFQNNHHFWPRPSANKYDPLSSGDDQLGPTSKALLKLFQERKKYWLDSHPGTDASKIPQILLFASGSGLDPHISPRAALFQVERIIKAINNPKLNREKIEELIHQYTENPSLGFLGEPRVNVFLLNKALDDALRDSK